jgi:hypothetical protein
LGPTCLFFHFRKILARIVGRKNGPELISPSFEPSPGDAQKGGGIHVTIRRLKFGI